tara:strand:- start:439 stop:942 length:504 start_codon:yes stop_codon:yes gene_type:complete
MDKRMTTNGARPYSYSKNPDDKQRAGRAWTFDEHAKLGDLIIEYYRVGGLRPIKESTYREWGEQMGRSPAALAYKASQRGLTYTNFETVPEVDTQVASEKSKQPIVMNIGDGGVVDLPEEWIARADRITDRLNDEGKYLAFGTMTRATVLRLAVQRGLDSLGAWINE